MNAKTLITIVGPTAIGKTSLAIALAKHFNSEIISCDSRQFYKEMYIGTAVPTQDELASVPHHFIQNKSITEPYSVGDFEREAIAFVKNYFQYNSVLVMVGGSGLYEKAVTEGLDDLPSVPDSCRQQLNQELEEFGIEKLQHELQEKDPIYYAEVDINNAHRIIRALEIIRHTGKTFSSFRSKNAKKRDFNVIKIGLKTDREIIYARINQRVEAMVANGLLDEVKGLTDFQHLNALQTVGYRELFDFFDGKIDLDFAISEIKKNTRRFAKRQLTWYRKDSAVNWFEPGENQKIIHFIERKIKSYED